MYICSFFSHLTTHHLTAHTVYHFLHCNNSSGLNGLNLPLLQMMLDLNSYHNEAEFHMYKSLILPQIKHL